MNRTSRHLWVLPPKISTSPSNGMVYRLTTRDGTAVIVEEADLEVITGYLTGRGHPPVSVELADEASEEILNMARAPFNR